MLRVGVEVAHKIEIANVIRRRDRAGEIIAHLLHVAVAVLTQHTAVGHGTTQTVGATAWMTLIAGLHQHITTFTLILDPEFILDSGRHRREQRIAVAVKYGSRDGSRCPLAKSRRRHQDDERENYSVLGFSCGISKVF